jgi:uncharacterized cysteine cluster protein YcgN (CxxCxxCC family)
MIRPRFWEGRRLAELSKAEWEALCDGCGKCCLHKLEDEESGRIYRTNVACRLLDRETAQCRDYKHRKREVPDCVQLTPGAVGNLPWLPSTCAYRRVNEGLPLPDWHWLECGDRQRVHTVGASIRGWTVNELEAGDLEAHILDDNDDSDLADVATS